MILKLLGLGKLIKAFFLQNWKWLLPLMLVVAGFFWTKEHYYVLGQETERLAWEKRVQKEQEKNDKITDTLEKSVGVLGEIALKEDVARKDKETIIETRINTVLEKPVYTDCQVDQEVVDEQNALKALGPKP
jgi:hypothetical protein